MTEESTNPNTGSGLTGCLVFILVAAMIGAVINGITSCSLDDSFKVGYYERSSNSYTSHIDFFHNQTVESQVSTGWGTVVKRGNYTVDAENKQIDVHWTNFQGHNMTDPSDLNRLSRRQTFTYGRGSGRDTVMVGETTYWLRRE